MFWIALLGMSLSWVLIKLGFLSATVGVMSTVIKLLLIAILIGATGGTLFWCRNKISRPTDRR